MSDRSRSEFTTDVRERDSSSSLEPHSRLGVSPPLTKGGPGGLAGKVGPAAQPNARHLVEPGSQTSEARLSSGAGSDPRSPPFVRGGDGRVFAWLAACGLLLLAGPAAAEQTEAPQPLSRPTAIAVSDDGGQVAVVCEATLRLVWIDGLAGKLIEDAPLPDVPLSVLLESPDTALVLGRSGRLLRIRRGSAEPLAQAQVAGHPVDCGRGAAGRTWVLDGGGDLIAVDPDLRPAVTVRLAAPVGAASQVASRPLALACSADGSRAAVTDAARDEVVLLDLLEARVLARVSLDGHLPRGVAFLDSEHLVLVHQTRPAAVPNVSVDWGLVLGNRLTIVDFTRPAEPRQAAIFLDNRVAGAANPWDVAVGPDAVYVAAAGTDTVLRIDRARLLALLDLPQSERDELSRRLDNPLRIGRLRVSRGPRALALSPAGDRLWLSAYFGGRVQGVALTAWPRGGDAASSGSSVAARLDNVADATGVAAAAIGEIPAFTFGPGPEAANAAQRGAAAFHDGRLSLNGWVSCASCHPGGGSDGLSHHTLSSDLGEARRTPALGGLAETAPYLWSGADADLTERCRNAFRKNLKLEPADEVVADVAAYLRELPAVPESAGEPQAAETIERGRSLFTGKARCADCHAPRSYASAKLASVVASERGEAVDPQAEKFNVPTLRGIGRGGPYLHDGRAATLEEIHQGHNADRLHGLFHLLSNAERADLLSFLKTL